MIRVRVWFLKLLYVISIVLLIISIIATLFGIFALVLLVSEPARTAVFSVIPWLNCYAMEVYGDVGLMGGAILIAVFSFSVSWLKDSWIVRPTSDSDDDSYYTYDDDDSDDYSYGQGMCTCLYCRHYFASATGPGQCMLYHQTRFAFDDICENYE